MTRRFFLRSSATLSAGSVLASLGCRYSATGSGFSRLRNSVVGSVLVSGDDGYEQVRRVASFNPGTDQRPAVIVRCATATDVARSLEYARSNDLQVAVRGGGHDVMGRSVCQGGVLIDLAPMREIRVVRDGQAAAVQAGARSGAVNRTLHESGLVAALGCHGGVGVAGLTLGGGLGWLLGRFGATCDNVTAVQLVTADGRQLRATEDEHADLFWGLKGGGGNFGIATAFEYRLHPLEKVVGGYLVYAGARATEVLRRYRDYMASAPDEMVVEVVLLASVEPPAHEPLLVLTACYSGRVEHADRAMRPFRAFGSPLAEVVRETPYARLTDTPPELSHLFEPRQSAETAATRAEGTGFNYWQAASLSNWTDQAIDAFVARATAAPPGWRLGIGHYQHGEMCRVDSQSTPMIRRQGSTSCFFNMSWRSSDRTAAAMAWVNQSLDTMQPFSDSATYVNYLSSDGEAAVAAAYGEHYQRLQALKRKFDPDNVFHLNRNIRP